MLSRIGAREWAKVGEHRVREEHGMDRPAKGQQWNHPLCSMNNKYNIETQNNGVPLCFTFRGTPLRKTKFKHTQSCFNVLISLWPTGWGKICIIKTCVIFLSCFILYLLKTELSQGVSSAAHRSRIEWNGNYLMVDSNQEMKCHSNQILSPFFEG